MEVAVHPRNRRLYGIAYAYGRSQAVAYIIIIIIIIIIPWINTNFLPLS